MNTQQLLEIGYKHILLNNEPLYLTMTITRPQIFEIYKNNLNNLGICGLLIRISSDYLIELEDQYVSLMLYLQLILISKGLSINDIKSILSVDTILDQIIQEELIDVGMALMSEDHIIYNPDFQNQLDESVEYYLGALYRP